MKYSFIYIALLVAAFSCKKKDQACKDNYTETDHLSLDHSMDSYQFKENTYWVYRNDVTNQLDSQLVVFSQRTDFKSGGSTNSCSGGLYTEQYKIGVRSFLTNKVFDYHIIDVFFSKDTVFNLAGNRSGRPIYDNKDPFIVDSQMELLEIIPSMNLNGHNFTNVKKILIPHIPHTPTNPNPYNISNHDLHYYFVDSIGLVKWEEVDGSSVLESWSIQSWEVFL